MTTERCDLSDLLVTECACRIHKPAPLQIPTHGPVFVAEYHGPCAACDDRVRPGDLARYGPDGLIVHEGCS